MQVHVLAQAAQAVADALDLQRILANAGPAFGCERIKKRMQNLVRVYARPAAGLSGAMRFGQHGFEVYCTKHELVP